MSKYLDSFLEEITANHENEIDSTPLEFTLRSDYLDQDDINKLLSFVSKPHNRLYIIEIQDNKEMSYKLSFKARRNFLHQNAVKVLRNSLTESPVNQLKKDLHDPYAPVRTAIQIQKTVPIPKPPRAYKKKQNENMEQPTIVENNGVAIEELSEEFPILYKQLQVLKVHSIHKTALEKIKEHPHAFTDGLVPGNMPKGFYIQEARICYTETPRRLPSALAPELKKPTLVTMPVVEQAKFLLPEIKPDILKELLDDNNHSAQAIALGAALPLLKRDIEKFLGSLPAEKKKLMTALFVKLFIFGGDSHATLFMQLINSAIQKNLKIDFLLDPVAQDSFLAPRGLKNLQKLLQLPVEQREWWNTLAVAHLKNKKHLFDFNEFFEAYSQVFLPMIAEKNLTLPQPCPIIHDGHFLITLNRVSDVLENAKNPQDQCLNLAANLGSTRSTLDWGPTGAHYAMTQGHFGQVSVYMDLKEAEGKVELQTVYQHLGKQDYDLKLWLWRFIGQHWKEEIKQGDIVNQIITIQNIPGWTQIEKDQFLLVVASSFSDESSLDDASWKQAIKNCQGLLQTLDPDSRSHLLAVLAQSFNFKPSPSLIKIQQLIEQCLTLKNKFTDLNFKTGILNLKTCLETEGFELINILQERGQKIKQTQEAQLRTIIQFTAILQDHRQNLSEDARKLLALVNEPGLSEEQVKKLEKTIIDLQAEKGDGFCQVLLSLLAKINIEKSESLPNLQKIQELLNAFIGMAENIPFELTSTETQENWIKDKIIEQNLLQGCVLGSSDISKLEDLLVDGISEGFKKRAELLQIASVKSALKELFENKLIKDIGKHLESKLFPILDIVESITTLINSPNPQFQDIVDKIKDFEDKKMELLQAEFSILGKTKGEYFLSLLITGKKKKSDNQTSVFLEKILIKVYETIVQDIKSFFSDEEIAGRTNLNAETVLKWMEECNETLTLTFLFREELIDKKVVPAIKKILYQLNTRDEAFEKTVLAAAKDFAEYLPSHEALKEYKIKIEAIVSYLNFLIDIKNHLSADHFSLVCQHLSKSTLSRLNYAQKQALVRNLLRAQAEWINSYLELTVSILEQNPDANEEAIGRAVDSLAVLFDLKDLQPDTQKTFFKMSMNHNLKNVVPFPLTIINELKKTNLSEETQNSIIKQIIRILSQMPNSESAKAVYDQIQQTKTFLAQNPQHADLCISLLKQISFQKVSLAAGKDDLSCYSDLLKQLMAEDYGDEDRTKLITILTGLANSKKDNTVNLPTLLDISGGLARRLRDGDVVDKVVSLFNTTPYPIAKRLNQVLLSHGSKELRDYCQSFDTNPFSESAEKRPLAQQFSTDRILEGLLNLKDLMRNIGLPHSVQLELARQLTYIETLGYTDELNPHDFESLKKLTASSRSDLKLRTKDLINQLRQLMTKFRSKAEDADLDQIKRVQLELLAYLREIYFRTTGSFPYTTQMLALLVSMHSPSTNLLMRIKTGEGKSLITPIAAVLQWAHAGEGETVDVCTANGTLLDRDYANSWEPFFSFLGIKSALIKADSKPDDYKLGQINCSTMEDMSLFRQMSKEAKKEKYTKNDKPIHLIIDESDDALLDQITLYKLVAEVAAEGVDNDPAKWIYPLAYQFINQPAFRNIDPAKGKVWNTEEDLEQFRLYIKKAIIEKFNGDAGKQDFILAATNTQLREWINASLRAAKFVENKQFLVCPIKEKDGDNEITRKMVCVPLNKSTPQRGVFTDGDQQAMQARLIAERKEQAHYFSIDPNPSVISSQSARGLIRSYQDTKGRIIGVSGTPGDQMELEYLASILGTQAIEIAPHAGDRCKRYPPIFTSSHEETIQVIHKTIDYVRHPVTKPTLEFNPEISAQTIADYDAIVRDIERARESWVVTQTQPFLIFCKDFDEVKTLGKTFATYEAEGYKVQLVTGTENEEQLKQIITRAGHPNTITLGTAMLARGIDINPGNHPNGLFVMSTYPAENQRILDQEAGRGSRNGKPGSFLPIYQVPPPQGRLEKLMCLYSPYRRSRCQKAIEKNQEEMRLQATVDRLYTQAIDHIQQTLMQQVEPLESFLLELYPNDPQMMYEIYQWRQKLLSEIAQLQDSSVSQKTLESSIAKFKNAVCRIWENSKDEKWIAKANQHAHAFTLEQDIRFRYLKQRDLSQELKVQRKLEQNIQPWTKALPAEAKHLMSYNLQGVIEDKAGAVLAFNPNLPESERKKLKLAQCRQLVPILIGELCAFYAKALNQFEPNYQPQIISSLMEILNSLMSKVGKSLGLNYKQWLFSVDDKKEVIQSIIKTYQKELAKAEIGSIQNQLAKVKDLIIQSNETAKLSIVNKFKMQGMIISFCKLYEQADMPNDETLNNLKKRYNEEIMKTLADHLMLKFKWVKNPSIFVFLERQVAKEAAEKIYEVAEELSNSPHNEEKIHMLYAALQHYRVALQDKYLFSLGHNNPRNVINSALDAIEALQIAPHCDLEYRVKCHDEEVVSYHLERFDQCLQRISKSFSNDVLWNHLKGRLIAIRDADKEHSYVITELYEAVKRFSGYSAYEPYRNQVSMMSELLAASMKTLNKPNVLKKDGLDSFLTQKASHFGKLLNLKPEQIRIQTSCDSTKRYIEMQVENAEFLADHEFIGYSTQHIDLNREKRDCERYLKNLQENREALLELTNMKEGLIKNLPNGKEKNEFELLLQLTKLLEQEDLASVAKLQDLLPEKHQDSLKQIQQFEQGLDNFEKICTPKFLEDSYFEPQKESLKPKFMEYLKLFQQVLDNFKVICTSEFLEDSYFESQKESLKTKFMECLKLGGNLMNLKKEKSKVIKQIETKKKEIDAKQQEVNLLEKEENVSLLDSIFGFKLNDAKTRLESLQSELSKLNKHSAQIESEIKERRENLSAVISALKANIQGVRILLINSTIANLKNFKAARTKELLAKLEEKVKDRETEINQLMRLEAGKSQFQTRRFSDVEALTKFEASLMREEGLIPSTQPKAQSSVYKWRSSAFYKPLSGSEHSRTTQGSPKPVPPPLGLEPARSVGTSKASIADFQ